MDHGNEKNGVKHIVLLSYAIVLKAQKFHFLGIL